MKHSRWTCVSLIAAVVVLHILCFARTTTTAFPSPRISRQSAVRISSSTSLANSVTNEDIVNLRAAVYQPPIRKVETGDKESPLKVLTEVADVLQLASKCAIDVVQFPELFLNGGLLMNEESAPLDRESYALNIVGNLCGELQVACSIGYAESGEENNAIHSSVAIFHADGSRAGNYRCLHPCSTLKKGHPLVEAMPITLLLPERTVTPSLQESITIEEDTKTTNTREIKIGVMCGGDLSVPEQARYLARNGANLLCVSGSVKDSKMASPVLIARSLENELPLLFSNYVDENFVGQSAILSSNAIELVRAPKCLDGDMPSEEGYFLPCETGGALYAADMKLQSDKKRIGTSIEQWDITPKIHQLTKKDGNKKGKEQDETSKGFGREVMNVLEQSKRKKLRLKNSKE